MSDDLLTMTADINGKPIPRWQERLEQMYTEGVPFGEVLSLVRYLIDQRAIDTILNMSDEEVLADFKARGGDIEQYAAEQRQAFDTVARLVRERDALLAACEQAHRALLERAPHSVPGGEEACEALRAAIAKARQEAS